MLLTGGLLTAGGASKRWRTGFQLNKEDNQQEAVITTWTLKHTENIQIPERP